MKIDKELLKLLLPEILVEYFDIIGFHHDEKEGIIISFDEKNIPPQNPNALHSKGFTPTIVVEDFPLRGKSVKLHIRKRRWTDTITGEIVQRNWQIAAKGTRLTTDFAEFLKKISQY